MTKVCLINNLWVNTGLFCKGNAWSAQIVTALTSHSLLPCKATEGSKLNYSTCHSLLALAFCISKNISCNAFNQQKTTNLLRYSLQCTFCVNGCTTKTKKNWAIYMKK